MIDAAVLGAFQHATLIAPPLIRRQVYNNAIDRVGLIESLASRELYYLVSEYVVAITRGHSALLLAVESMCVDFDVYAKEAITRTPRRKLWQLGKAEKSSRRCRSAATARQRTVTTDASIMLPAIIRALSIRLKTTAPPTIHRDAFEVGRKTASACLNIGVLEELLTPPIAKKFCADLMGENRPVKKATVAVAGLGEKKAVLSAYFRGWLAANAGDSPTLRAFPVDECEVLVCTNCSTLRSGAKGLGRLNSKGVNIDCSTNSITCIDCGGETASVKLGQVIYRQLIKKNILVTMCDSCRLPTTVTEGSAIGAGFMCATCLKSLRRVPELCICGELGGPKFARVASARKTILYAICEMCARRGLPETEMSLETAALLS